MNPEILRLVAVEKSYDGVQALRRADFSVASGEVHALMGENGAGKSTLSKIIAGSERADSCQYFLGGTRVEIDGPSAAQALGISMIYQELDLFPHLTVAENLAIGNRRSKQSSFVKFKELDRFARPFLLQVGLACGRAFSSWTSPPARCSTIRLKDCSA
jgi:ABC-type sugar transport system ATPase subunit